jgi:hypothetical protein
MQAKLTNRSVERVIDAIEALDLEPVKQRVMDAELGEGWTREYAESIERGYKNYLTMLTKYQEDAEDIVLSKDVDEFWHAHILQTIKYTDDCDRVFGMYLHHNPHIGERTQADIERKVALAEKTRRLYQEEFGGAQHYLTVRSGGSVKAEKAAYCGATLGAQDAAYCGTTVKAQDIAYCGATVRAQDAAYCGATVRAQDTAYCGATIRT